MEKIVNSLPNVEKGVTGQFILAIEGPSSYFSNRRAIIRNLKDELKPGTLHAIMKQLGIEESDLY
jgi:hypothetical protein